MKQPGDMIEDLVESICTSMFFADFTVRSPKFVKEGGKELEIGDILVPFGKHLLSIQVKTRQETTLPEERNAVDWERIQRKLEEAVEQLKNVNRFLEVAGDATLTTVRGVSIPFSSKKIERVLGVVVFDLIGEEEITSEERTTIFKGFVQRQEMPVHAFMRDDFEAIAEWVDTIPDFIEYLEKRQALMKRDILVSLTSEKELLAGFLLMPKVIDDALSGKCDYLVLDLWDHFQKDADEVQRLKAVVEPSYVVDEVIARQYESIGYDPETSNGVKLSDYGEHGTVSVYMKAITALASLKRAERTHIGKNLIEVRQKAVGKDTGWARGFALAEEGKCIVLLATERRRDEGRTSVLHGYCLDNLKKSFKAVIGIATEAEGAVSRSYDVCLVGNWD